MVAADFIGIDAAGTTALGNTFAGVRDGATGNTYGMPLIGNVISGNGPGGIKAAGSITVQQNNIGTNAAGTAALGNGPGGAGIQDTAFPVTQTITTKIIGNIVSGNHQFGISIGVGDQATSTYTITDNLVGTDVNGAVALPNSGAGVDLESVENTSFLRNLVSGNAGPGVQFSGFGPDVEHNVFQGNKIGTNSAGTGNLGNTASGFRFSNTIGTTIGGPSSGQENTIAFNGGDGINLTGGHQNTITENSIFGNAGKGIGPSSGTNNGVTPPTLTYQNGTLTATYAGGPANQDMLIEVFNNPALPAAGHEQGKTFVNSFFVTTNASGNGSAGMAEPPGIYTATGTDDSFNTSAFSNPVDAASLPATTTTVTTSLNPSTFGQAATFKAIVTAPDVFATGTVIFTIDGQASPLIPLVVVGANGQATFTPPTLSVGLHSVSAAYSGNSNLSPSSGTLPTEAVVAAASSVILTAAPNPPSFGDQVVLTATVTSATGAAVGGTVAFVEGTTVLGFGVVGPGGHATLAMSPLPVGSTAIAAVYSGDAGHAQSASNVLVQTVEAPTVLAPRVLALRRFGFHAQPTILSLAFSAALETASAEKVANYRIVLLNAHGRPVRGHTIAVRGTRYDPSTSSVTLVPAQRPNVHYHYALTVDGTTPVGVRGASGLLLDGNGDGKPGSDYVAEITFETLVGPIPGFTKTPALAGVKRAAPASTTALDRLATSGELAVLASRLPRP